jgi:hypothetical protein
LVLRKENIVRVGLKAHPGCLRVQVLNVFQVKAGALINVEGLNKGCGLY